MFERLEVLLEKFVESTQELGEARRASIARAFGEQTITKCNPCIDGDVRTQIEIARMSQDEI